MNIIEKQIPKSMVIVQKRFLEHAGQIKIEYGIVVREKRYERIIFLSEDEMNNIFEAYNILKEG